MFLPSVCELPQNYRVHMCQQFARNFIGPQVRTRNDFIEEDKHSRRATVSFAPSRDVATIARPFSINRTGQPLVNYKLLCGVDVLLQAVVVSPSADGWEEASVTTSLSMCGAAALSGFQFGGKPASWMRDR